MTERVARPELVTTCTSAKGWRRDDIGNWWPCTEQDVKQEEKA